MTTTRREIYIEHIRSLGFWDIGGGVTLQWVALQSFLHSTPLLRSMGPSVR